MDAEAEQGLDDRSELKVEVKGEDDGTGEVVASLGQDGSGDGHEKVVEANEDESKLQEDQGAGDCHLKEETKTNDGQPEGGVDGGGEGGNENAEGQGERESQANNANAIEPEGTSEETVEQGEVQIEEELKRSKKGDEGDEVVSSKVTTVSFASEVQVLNEDELEEQWPIAEGDDDVVVAEKGDGVGESIIEPDENKAEIDNSADVTTEADVSLGDDKVEIGTPVLAEEYGNVLEDTPVAKPESDQQEPSDMASAENTAPSEEAVAVKTPEESNEVTTEHDNIGGQEQELPEITPLSDARVDNHTSVEDENSSEQVFLEAEQAEGNGEEILDDIPVAQLIEEPEREIVIEYKTVVLRSMKSSAPEVTLEAAAEEIIEQVGTSAEGPEEGDGNETKEDVYAPPLEEIEAEHDVAQIEVNVQRSYMSNAPEHGVEALVMEEQTSEEARESNSPVPVPEGDEAGKEAHPDDNQQELLDGIPEENLGDDGAVDNHTELQVDSALESQIFEDSQDEPYQDLTVPTGSIPYETDPNLSSVNQEDVPMDGNFSEYDQPPMMASDVEPLPPIEPEMVRQDIHQLQEQQRMEGLSPIELLTQANQAHGVLPSPLRSPYHQQHPHSGSKLESTSRATNLSRVQIARIPSPPAHIKAQMMMEEERRASTRTSSRLPPSVMKMSSVMVNARKKAVKNRNASVYYEERQFHKILTLDECINSRPPMQFDLDTPGPCRYSPRNKPLYEDNAPEYTFGMKFPERAGGGRTAYAKTWFNSTDNFTAKTRFERRWPSPNAYGRGRSMVGRKVPDKKDYPAFSMRGKTNFVINKKGSENEPGPDQYHRQRSDPLLFRRAPAFSMGAKLNRGRLFGAPEITPAPNYYNPHTNYTSRKVTYPAFTISGVRKPKSHALGPHATL
ncbi:uncharacterized protein LOC121429167 [Lytechinus variegatus]|uniref:uncharacterized protein LOC121429167 n=1 Tax=Lytechinus variegatus TaxID=7654 RepID=UPI001BB131E4|nr:uncharacterized protein LOC121429167 [Lytechinus variegatus]